MPRAPRVGLFGGTFDPPHVGHLRVAEAAREVLALDRVLWVPAAANPHKVGRPRTPAAHRLAMVERAVADNGAFAVSDVEVARQGVSYTVDTLRTLAAAQPDVEWTLLLGGDALAGFARWREPEALLGIARLGVYPRRDSALTAVPEWIRERATVLEAPLLDVSATVVRGLLQAGRSARYLVPDAVLAYAEAKGLYGASLG